MGQDQYCNWPLQLSFAKELANAFKNYHYKANLNTLNFPF